uniref:Uncharacterized protein n=1 Tax=Arundo donax TaxID=35708 RepID=A0A0A9GE13_ARUDO
MVKIFFNPTVHCSVFYGVMCRIYFLHANFVTTIRIIQICVRLKKALHMMPVYKTITEKSKYFVTRIRRCDFDAFNNCEVIFGANIFFWVSSKRILFFGMLCIDKTWLIYIVLKIL